MPNNKPAANASSKKKRAATYPELHKIHPDLPAKKPAINRYLLWAAIALLIVVIVVTLVGSLAIQATPELQEPAAILNNQPAPASAIPSTASPEPIYTPIPPYKGPSIEGYTADSCKKDETLIVAYPESGKNAFKDCLTSTPANYSLGEAFFMEGWLNKDKAHATVLGNWTTATTYLLKSFHYEKGLYRVESSCDDSGQVEIFNQYGYLYGIGCNKNPGVDDSVFEMTESGWGYVMVTIHNVKGATGGKVKFLYLPVTNVTP
jgi:hypothetical protein